MNYWLMKSEPSVYSIDDLKRDRTTYWDGVRNYQARNYMRDTMKIGDQALFYHSNAEPSGVAGICEIAREGYPDDTSWDPKDIHYDPKSTKDHPLWYRVDVAFVKKFDRVLSLEEIKKHPLLGQMLVARPGTRLSVQPVEKEHFKALCRLAVGK